jgi:hypothetical protein
MPGDDGGLVPPASEMPEEELNAEDAWQHCHRRTLEAMHGRMPQPALPDPGPPQRTV